MMDASKMNKKTIGLWSRPFIRIRDRESWPDLIKLIGQSPFAIEFVCSLRLPIGATLASDTNERP
jgi:hypothetical protein